MIKNYSLLSVFLLASVAACGGGGGGSGAGSAGGSTSGATNTVTGPENVPLFTPSQGGTAPANVAGFSFQCPGACPASTAVGSTGDNTASTVTLKTDATTGDQTMALNIIAGGAAIQHTFDLGIGGANISALKNDPGGGPGWNGFFDANPNEAPDANGNTFDVKFAGSAHDTGMLQWTTFGLWSQSNIDGSKPGGFGVFATGSETTPSSMAAITANATASYSGTVIGLGQLNGLATNVTGTVAATATFGGATPNVAGTVVANIFPDTAGASGYWNTLSFNTPITAGTSHFGGTITAPAVQANVNDQFGNTPVITTGAMSGPINGSFYGNLTSATPGGVATPAEIGAVFNLTDKNGPNNMLGAFGAHK